MNREQFNNWVHKFCIPTSALLLLGMFGYPVIVSAVYHTWPNWSQLIPGIITLFLMMLPWWPAEYFGYMSVMGPGAMYMSYITGNVTNLRMPATVGTINALGIEPGTDECHTLAIVACAASNFTTVIIIVLGLLLSVPLTPVLTAPALQPAFNMALPALFGGICAQNVFKKSPKEWAMWLIPLAVGLLFTYVVKISAAYMMLIVTILGAILWFAKFKADQKKTAN